MGNGAEPVTSGVWNSFGRSFVLACCDCGLCHKVTIRKRNGRYQIRLTWAGGYTAAIRREAKKRAAREASKK